MPQLGPTNPRDHLIHQPRSAAAAVALGVGVLATAATAGTVVPVAGHTPWVVLECSYADVPSIPATPDTIQSALFGTATTSASAYWRDNSFGTIDLNGSVVDAWQPIRARANYHTAGGIPVDRPALMRDCIAAHPAVAISASSRVLVITNATNGHDSGGFQGGVTGTAFAGGTILQAGNYTSPYLLGQEMGHAYGLNHAWDDRGVEYADEYDVMGNMGVGLTMAERDALQWLAPSRVATRSTGLPSYELSAPFHATRAGYDMLRVSDPYRGPAEATSNGSTAADRRSITWDAGVGPSSSEPRSALATAVDPVGNTGRSAVLSR